MAGSVSGGAAVKRLTEVVDSIIALAEREEGIARDLRRRASTGQMPDDVKHRAHARADSLFRLAGDLRAIVGERGHRR